MILKNGKAADVRVGKSVASLLDEHEYPDIVYRHPSLVRLLHWFNGVITLRNWYVRRHLKQLMFSMPEKFSLLDAGCGLGDFAFYCAKARPDSFIVGMDFSSSNIQLATEVALYRKVSNITFVRGDISNLNWPNQFDFILCTAVLQSVAADEDVLRGFARHLKKDGTLLLYVPITYKRYLPWFAQLEERYLSQFFYRYDGAFGYHKYTVNEIRAKIARSGLTIHRQFYSYGFFGAIAFELYSLLLTLLKVVPLPLFIVLAIIYACTLFPIQMVFMALDYVAPKTLGNGMLILARNV